MPNASIKSFDDSLMKIVHYQSFPAMLPFVGEDYDSANHSKMLIVGESFYFPEDSTLHKDPAKWYSATQVLLNPEEIAYIDCKGLLECDWNYGGHKIYREINACLAELNLPFHDRPVSNISFTNAFMRPATESGNSFKYCCVEQDVAESVKVLTDIISILRPDIVIFVSKYAWDTVGWKIKSQVKETAFDFVSHPADPFHWNDESYEHGRDKFIMLLKKWKEKPS